MPGYLLTEASQVDCTHKGQVQTQVESRVKIDGKAVRVLASPTSPIKGCTLPSIAGGPCVTALWTFVVPRIRVGGRPVLLQDSQATCIPTGTPLAVNAGQRLVKETMRDG